MVSTEQRLRATETNGGRVVQTYDPDGWRLLLPLVRPGYGNAQLDDYRQNGGPKFRWSPGTHLALRARFSAGEADLVGTAGFGFWNAPFGPGTGRRVRLPRAVWFFYASRASDLPLAPFGAEGNGWFASTIDVSLSGALTWAVWGLPVLLLNQISHVRRILWARLRRDLNMTFEHVPIDMRHWHTYEILWRHQHTMFRVDGWPLFITPFSPRGPLGFVMWIDNQALVMTPTGRISWKTEVGNEQSLDVAAFHLDDDAQ